MKNILFLAILTSIIATGCTSLPISQKPTTQNDAAQQTLNELKKGVAILFQSNSSEIDAEYDVYLAAAAQALAQNKSFHLALEGHTDSTGSAAKNVKVSLERANAVRNKLVMDYNVRPEQVSTVGAGSAHPIDNNETAEGRANNRRVDAMLKIQ